MKTNTKFILSILIVICLLACSERQTNHYPKYEDAVKDGAINRGWLPEIVPATAIEIYEQHDLDTNDVWIRFTLSSSERESIIRNLNILSHKEIIEIKLRNPSSVNWWFEGVIQQSPENDNALNANIYAVKCFGGRNGYIAFDRTSQKVYYWCTL
jgi:hypothetical protein